MLPHTSGLVHLCNAAGDTATVSLYGGQVVSWCTADGGEQLYCSPHALEPGRAVRGGVPVCFPQFANCGTLLKHGFARTSTWNLYGPLTTGLFATEASASFTLQNSPLTQSLWPFKFTLKLDVSLGDGWIKLALAVNNSGDKAFEFTAALHTYLAVADVQQVAVCGLASIPYLDTLQQNAVVTSIATLVHITAETDRVYLGPPCNLDLLQNGLAHVRIEQAGFVDTVVWNPGPTKAAVLGDMPAADWLRMLCIEAAQIEHPVRLEPGTHWLGKQRLTFLAPRTQNKGN